MIPSTPVQRLLAWFPGLRAHETASKYVVQVDVDCFDRPLSPRDFHDALELLDRRGVPIHVQWALAYAPDGAITGLQLHAFSYVTLLHTPR